MMVAGLWEYYYMLDEKVFVSSLCLTTMNTGAGTLLRHDSIIQFRYPEKIMMMLGTHLCSVNSSGVRAVRTRMLERNLWI